MRSNVVASVLALGMALGMAGACHDHDHGGGFPTFRECFVEHHEREGYNEPMSIAICALDHPIDGHSLEFATASECTIYVTDALEDMDATAEQIMAGCNDYITQKDM